MWTILTDLALAQPWFALAAITAGTSGVLALVRELAGVAKVRPADTMAWRGVATGAGWRPDPSGRHSHRFHDGLGWTTLVVTADGRAADDPLGLPTA